MSPGMQKRKRDSQPETGGGERLRMFAKTTSPNRKIKSEAEEFSERYETESSEGDDSEDEMPLAKRRYAGVKTGNASFEDSSMVISHRGSSSGFHGGRSLEPNGQLDISRSRPDIHVNALQ